MKQVCSIIDVRILLILFIFQTLSLNAAYGMPSFSGVPAVTILSPAIADTFDVNDYVFPLGQTVTISAVASASDAITKMEVLDNGISLYIFLNKATISYDWTSALPGSHTITVKAYTASNAVGTDWTYIGIAERDAIYIGSAGSALDGEFNAYTNTTGKIGPAGWTADAKYTNGGRILASAAGRDGSPCVCMATTDPTKGDISPYMQAANFSGLVGTIAFEMDVKQEIVSSDLRMIITGYESGDSSSVQLFYMKGGNFTAAENGRSSSEYPSFGAYLKDQWYHVKMVIHVESGLMDFYLDGTKRLSNIAMRLNPANLQKIQISHAGKNAAGTTYIDNVNFYKEKSGPRVREVKLTDGTRSEVEPSLYVPLGTEKITLRFYEPVIPGSCASAVGLTTSSGGAVPFSDSYNASENSYTLTLTQPLSPKTKYVLECGTALTDGNNSMPYKRIWVFAPEASAYKVNGPRLFSGGKEILNLLEAGEGVLHVEASVSQNKSGASAITAVAAVYRNKRMTGVVMSNQTVTAGLSSDFKIDLDFPGYTENMELKFFVWDGMTPVYSESFTADMGVPIIRNGFENTTISTLNNKQYILSGADSAWPAPNDWSAAASDAAVNFTYINTETGTSAERVPMITADPVTSSNKVLKFVQNQVTTASKGRVELDFYLNEGVRAVHFKERVFLHNDFNKLLSYPGAIDWLSLFEFWNEDGWSDKLFPYRLTIGLSKPVANATGFYFNATAQKAESENFVDIWSEEPHNFQVPVGKWMTWEIFYREGDANTGRFIFAVTPDNEVRQVVLNVNNWTYAPGNPNPRGLPILHPMKMYTSKQVVNYLYKNAGALQIYWDNFELYRYGGW